MTAMELTTKQAAALKAKSASEETSPRAKALKSAHGLLAKYGPSPSAEEIDENRRDRFRGFGKDF